MGIQITSKGSWQNTSDYLTKMSKTDIFASLEKYGVAGVNALASATPVDSGVTAESWGYEVVHRHGYYAIRWYNTHVDDQGQPIAIMLQYGHGTGTGGYVEGRDYIMPAISPIFDQIASEVWKVVSANAEY